MEECCANCKRQLKLVKYDYSQGGCKHTDQEGFICLDFQNEGIAIWMSGIDVNTAFCEDFVSK